MKLSDDVQFIYVDVPEEGWRGVKLSVLAPFLLPHISTSKDTSIKNWCQYREMNILTNDTLYVTNGITRGVGDG